jgi:predicted MFS family arabinose efflux permease
MALWAVAFLGSTPIGGPVAGYISQHFGGRAGLVLGGVACLAAALGALMLLRRSAGRAKRPEPSGQPSLAA